jgi:hypothetical protein
MRRKLLFAVAATVGVIAPMAGAASPGHAMTCAPADEPLGYACRVGFYVVGSACRGQLPTNPPPPPVTLNSAAMQINLCPPLG